MRVLIISFFSVSLSILILILVAGHVSAQVVINEFVPDANPEWVEFYNKDQNSADLSEYFFDDEADFDSDEGSSEITSLFGILGPTQACYWNLSTYLNNDEDTPTLFSEDGDIVDTYTYAQPAEDKSYARIPDGGEWQVGQTPTKVTTNCSNLAPTPTSTPTLSPSPTPTPTLTPTPTPTPKPTLTPKPTFSPTPKPTEATQEAGEENLVLGLREELNSPSPTTIPDGENKRKFPILAGVLIFVGLVIGGFGLYSFFRNKQKGYNEGDGEIA